MKCVELNRKGDFDRWDQSWLSELEHIHTTEGSHDDVIFQNDRVTLSLIGLESYQRAPFRIIKTDFNLICLTGGLAITRFSHGGISLLNFDKGESVTRALKNSVMVNDLQNIGQDPLVFALVEYDQGFVQDEFVEHLLKSIASVEHR